MMSNKRRATWSYRSRAPPTKRRTTYGLRPTYRGWNPRQFIRGEWKFLDTVINDQNVNTTPVLTLLNGLVPGNSASQRIGMKVQIKSLQMHLSNYVISGSGIDQIHRMWIVIDRQANGLAPTLAQIMTQADTMGLRNLENRRRFKIVMDKSFLLNATGEPGSSKLWKVYMKFKRPIVVEYNSGVAGTVADIVSNSLYFIQVGTSAAGVTAGKVIGNIRIRYLDL